MAYIFRSNDRKRGILLLTCARIIVRIKLHRKLMWTWQLNLACGCSFLRNNVIDSHWVTVGMTRCFTFRSFLIIGVFESHIKKTRILRIINKIMEIIIRNIVIIEMIIKIDRKTRQNLLGINFRNQSVQQRHTTTVLFLTFFLPLNNFLVNFVRFFNSNFRTSYCLFNKRINTFEQFRNTCRVDLPQMTRIFRVIEYPGLQEVQMWLQLKIFAFNSV